MANTAPTFVNVSAQVAANSSPQTVTLPASTTTGDWLLIVCIQSSAAAVVFASSGYTSLARNANATRTMTIEVLKKVHSGSESNPSVTCDTAAAGWAVQMVAYRGVLAEDAADVSSDAAAAQTFQPTQITTVVDNSMVCSFAGTKDDNALTYNNQNSFSDRMSGANYDATAGNGSDYSVGWADIVKVSHGAQTMPTWNQSANGNDAWVALSIALAPPTDIPEDITGEQMTQTEPASQSLLLSIAKSFTGEQMTQTEPASQSLAIDGLAIIGESITFTDARALGYGNDIRDSFTLTDLPRLGYGLGIPDAITFDDLGSVAITGAMLFDSFTVTDFPELGYGLGILESSATLDDFSSRSLDIIAGTLDLTLSRSDQLVFDDAATEDLTGPPEITEVFVEAFSPMGEACVVLLTTPPPPVIKTEWRAIYFQGGQAGWSRRTLG